VEGKIREKARRRMVEPKQRKAVSSAEEKIRKKALLFLGDWLCRADSEAIKLFARWKDTADHIQQPDDWLTHLVSFGIRTATRGETPWDVLRETPTKHLVKQLKAKGFNADEATIRKALNHIGVEKLRGRPACKREKAG
jgi:hypothetical protein